MAARCDLNVFIQHRREAEGIDRATGESLAAIGTTYNERCRCRGERVGQLDAVAAQYEEVLVAQGGERFGDRLRLGACKALGNSCNSHGTPGIGEQPEDGPKPGRFPGYSAGPGSRFDIVVSKLVRSLDHEVRQDRASFPSRDEGTVCSNSRLKGLFGEGRAWTAPVGSPSAGCRSTLAPTSRGSAPTRGGRCCPRPLRVRGTSAPTLSLTPRG